MHYIESTSHKKNLSLSSVLNFNLAYSFLGIIIYQALLVFAWKKVYFSFQKIGVIKKNGITECLVFRAVELEFMSYTTSHCFQNSPFIRSISFASWDSFSVQKVVVQTVTYKPVYSC